MSWRSRVYFPGSLKAQLSLYQLGDLRQVAQPLGDSIPLPVKWGQQQDLPYKLAVRME